MSISAEQNAAAASEFAELAEKQFGGSGVTVSVEHHSNAAKYAFVRLTCPPQHWIALAKWMRFDGGVNYCSMITGTHYPDGAERGWGVAYHFLRQPVRDVEPFTADVLKASDLSGASIPLKSRSSSTYLLAMHLLCQAFNRFGLVLIGTRRRHGISLVFALKVTKTCIES